MSAIQAVFEKINEVEATIQVLERETAGEPTFADEMALSSLKVEREELRMLADDLAAEHRVDVCDYRIIPAYEDGFPIKAVGETLTSFQNAFTAMYAAIREKKARAKAKFSAEVVQAAQLKMGYAYSGSLGLVLYRHADTFLDEDSDHDRAMAAMLSLVDCDDNDSIRAAAEEYGKAVIATFYKWSKAQVENKFSVDLQWRRGTSTKVEKLVQPEQLQSVLDVVDRNPDTSQSVETVHGILVALDVQRQTFKLSFPEAQDIRGSFDKEFDWKIPHEIPGRYVAKLRKETRRPLWSDDEKVDWSLIDLKDQ